MGSNIVYLELDGIAINKKSVTKDITYFECSSTNLKNAPECHFSVRDFDPEQPQGSLEIISKHSKNCKFIPGNSVIDFSKNKSLNASTKKYKEMYLCIEKKLEESHWLSTLEIENWIKQEYAIDKHLSYEQFQEIVNDWSKKTLSVVKSL